MVAKNTKFEEYKYPIIVVAGSVLASIIMIFLILIPAWNNAAKTNQEVGVKKAELTALQGRLENLKKLKDQEAELKEKNAKVLAALPEEKDVSRLFVQLESIAAQSGLTINQVSEGQAAASGSASTTPNSDLIRTVNYSLVGKGTNYASLKSALSKFEQALRILSISSIDAAKTTDLSLTFGVTTYIRNVK